MTVCGAPACTTSSLVTCLPSAAYTWATLHLQLMTSDILQDPCLHLKLSQDLSAFGSSHLGFCAFAAHDWRRFAGPLPAPQALSRPVCRLQLTPGLLCILQLTSGYILQDPCLHHKLCSTPACTTISIKTRLPSAAHTWATEHFAALDWQHYVTPGLSHLGCRALGSS